MKMIIETEVDINKLWEAVWGCDGKGMTYWCNKVRKSNGHDINLWKKNKDGDYEPNPQDFRVYDYEENKSHKVTLENLMSGYAAAKANNQKHCWTYDLDLDDYDDCFGDLVIQYAIFGKLVYG